MKERRSGEGVICPLCGTKVKFVVEDCEDESGAYNTWFECDVCGWKGYGITVY